MPNKAEGQGYLKLSGPRAVERASMRRLTCPEDIAHSPQSGKIAEEVGALVKIISGEATVKSSHGIVMSTRIHDFWDALESRASGVPHIRLNLHNDGRLSIAINPDTGEVSVPEEMKMSADEIAAEQDRKPDEVVLVQSRPEVLLEDGSRVSLSLFQSSDNPNEFCITNTRIYPTQIRYGMNTIASEVLVYRIGRNGTLTPGTVAPPSKRFGPSVLRLAQSSVAEDSGIRFWQGLSAGELLASTEAYKILGNRYGFITSG